MHRPGLPRQEERISLKQASQYLAETWEWEVSDKNLHHWIKRGLLAGRVCLEWDWLHKNGKPARHTSREAVDRFVQTYNRFRREDEDGNQPHLFLGGERIIADLTIVPPPNATPGESHG